MITIDINDALSRFQNMTAETDFESEFHSMKMRWDDRKGLIIETETLRPVSGIRTSKQDDIVRRRFTMNLKNEVVVEVDAAIEGPREWIPEEEADWLQPSPSSV